MIFNENLGKVVEQYCKKGSKVYVEGQLQTRKWQDKDGNDRYTTEVVLQRFRGELQLLDSRGGSEGRDSFPDEGGGRRSSSTAPAASDRRPAPSGGGGGAGRRRSTTTSRSEWSAKLLSSLQVRVLPQQLVSWLRSYGVRAEGDRSAETTPDKGGPRPRQWVPASIQPVTKLNPS